MWLRIFLRILFDKLILDSIFSFLVKFKLPYEAVRFLVDFLSGRRQRVLFQETFSKWSRITSGVPQGSVLGPVLFTKMIDSLSPLPQNSVYIKYADDVTILHFVLSADEDFLQHEWSHLENWSGTFGLSLNYSKCLVKNCVTKNALIVKPVRSIEETFFTNGILHLFTWCYFSKT